MNLTLVLPCYNESKHLVQSMDEIVRVLDQSRLSYEIILVEDKSTDDTRKILSDWCKDQSNVKVLLHEENKGHGEALRNGFAIAKGEVIGFIDIDLEVSAVYIPNLVNKILLDGFDIATGYRFYGFLLNTNAIVRALLSLGYRLLFRFLMRINLKDTETGYKFFRKKIYLELQPEIKSRGWFWDTEFMVKAFMKGYRIAEIPVLFLRRKDKKTTIKVFSYTIRHFRELVNFSSEQGRR